MQSHRPQPKNISDALFNSIPFPGNNLSADGIFDPIHNIATVQWAQFIEHDLVKTVVRTMGNNCPIECCEQDMSSAPPRYTHPSCSPLKVTGNFGKYITCLSYVRSAIGVHPNCHFGAANQVCNFWLDFFFLSVSHSRLSIIVWLVYWFKLLVGFFFLSFNIKIKFWWSVWYGHMCVIKVSPIGNVTMICIVNQFLWLESMFYNKFMLRKVNRGLFVFCIHTDSLGYLIGHDQQKIFHQKMYLLINYFFYICLLFEEWIKHLHWSALSSPNIPSFWYRQIFLLFTLTPQIWMSCLGLRLLL